MVDSPTLKAFANFSPGLRLGNPGKRDKSLEVLAIPIYRDCVFFKRLATPSELPKTEGTLTAQGFKANPGLKFANAFSVSGESTNLILLYRYEESSIRWVYAVVVG